MTKLQQLHSDHGQSAWLDNLSRHHLRSGALRRLIDDGIRGVTSNPTIFAKAISGSQLVICGTATSSRPISSTDAVAGRSQDARMAGAPDSAA